MPKNAALLPPTIFVIFGITGDLAQRKLLPALYHLFKDDLLGAKTKIVGLSRRDIDPHELLDKVKLCVLEADKTCDQAVLDRFQDNLQMVQFNPAEAADYDRLKTTLDGIEERLGECMNRLIYLAIPPSVYGTVVKNLGQQHLNTGCQHGTAHSALLVEKPFGYDLKSAEELIAETGKYFDESQIYRIDHYLAKETAQNILTFRRDNPLFEDVWNGSYIHKVDVVAAEKIGVEGRASFYDDVGALRDLIQSHLMQLLALVTMELPAKMSDRTLHDAKKAVLDSIQPVPPGMVASRAKRGQYIGYLADVANPGSTTETFASVQLQIPTKRWHETIFYLSTGKCLAEKKTLVRMTFSGHGDSHGDNQLTFRIQPNEGIDVTLRVKKPGFTDESEPAVMDFDYTSAAHPDAYERVLVDAVRGDHILFASSQEVMASWRVLQPILDAWQKSSDDLELYKPGSKTL